MMSAVPNGATVVRRLRIAGGGRDPSLTALRAGAVLSGARLHPSGLPPSALLCVRALRDPLPGSLGPGTRVGPPVDWEAAVNASLDRLLRHALRPALGTGRSDAEAVLFADRAELLACLASDWCDGTALTRWWWRGLFGRNDVRRAVLEAWLDAPEYVPAAIHHLAARARAVAFVGALSEPEVNAVAQRMTTRFGLSDLWFALMHAPERTSDPAPVATDVAGTPALTARPMSRDRTAPRVPWSVHVTESDTAALRPDQQHLLGIALMLRRDPAVVRSRCFEDALVAWTDARAPSVRTRCPTDALDIRDAGTYGVTPGGEPAAAACGEIGIAAAPTPTTGDPPAPRQPLGAGATVRLIADAGAGADQAIDTRLGGLFFLLNVGLALNLYGDFTTPRAPGIALSPWDFVALIGRRLIGETLVDDPAWVLLAELAGRSTAESAGEGFEPADEWRLPPDWLRPFDDPAVWQWSATEGRLRVRHPAGFRVLDVALAGVEPRRRLRQEMARYGAALRSERERGERVAGTRRADASPLEWWLDRLIGYVAARLRRALGARGTDEEIARLVCLHAAHVTATATHVDVLLSLEALPVAIRLAGLDRDPGWVPAAGRFIAFHYA